MKLAPDEAFAEDGGRVGEGDGVVGVADVDGFVAQELAVTVRRIESVDGGEGEFIELVTLFLFGVVEGEFVELVTLFLFGVVVALANDDATVFDVDDAPLRLFEDGAPEAFGGVADGAEFAEGGANGVFDGGGEALEGEVSVGIPSEGAVGSEKELFFLGLPAFDHEIPDVVVGGDEGAGEEDGDGVDGVVHVGEVAHVAFGDDSGLLDAILLIGLDEPDVELGEHAEEVVVGTDFFGDAAGDEGGADGLAAAGLEPAKDGTVGELGDGGGLREHALGHAFGFVNGEHSELFDPPPGDVAFFADGACAFQPLDGGKVFTLRADLEGDDLPIGAGGLERLPAAVADELSGGAGAFEAIDGVEGEDKGVHRVRGALAMGEDVVEIHRLASDVPGVEGLAGVGAGEVEV